MDNIIVYRNPLEAAIWEGDCPVVAWLAAFFLVVIVISLIVGAIREIIRRKRNSSVIGHRRW